MKNLSNKYQGDTGYGECGTGGNFSLSSVSMVLTRSDGKTYVVHGTLDSTMPALAGYASGTVKLHATF